MTVVLHDSELDEYLEVATVEIRESVQMMCRVWVAMHATVTQTKQNINSFYSIRAARGSALSLLLWLFICCKVLLMANDLKSTKV